MHHRESHKGPKLFLAIAGNIGTGKSTLANLLSEKYKWEAHFEVVNDNPYLADFYENMARWSFPLQIFFLNSRYRAHQAIVKGSNSAIQDRSIYEDANIFAKNLYDNGLMEKRDYYNYLDIYQELCANLPPPDLLIYLRKDLPRLKENINKRGRGYESKISDSYLSDLNKLYDEWIESYRLGKVLVIDSNQLDFVKHPEHMELVSRRIFETLDQQEMFSDAGPNLRLRPTAI